MKLEKGELRAATSTTNERVAAGLWREGEAQLLLSLPELRWLIHTAGPALVHELEKAVT